MVTTWSLMAAASTCLTSLEYDQSRDGVEGAITSGSSLALSAQ
jgi:hypothetical protein